MKKSKVVLILICCFVLFQFDSSAQRDWLLKADRKFYGERYFEATALYKKAYPQKRPLSEKSRILFQIGECYRNQHEVGQAVTWYRKAIKSGNETPELHMNYALCLKQLGKCEEAVAHYTKNATFFEGDAASNQINGCAEVQTWFQEKSQIRIMPEFLLNSPFYDFSPQVHIVNGKRQMYFSSTRNESTGDSFDPRVGQNFTDIFFTTQDAKGKWSIPIPISDDVNSDLHEGSIALSKDGKEMYFTRCPFNEVDKWGCDVYYTKKRGRSWTDPVKLAFRTEGDDTSSYRHPAISSDGKTLIISSNQPDGFGGNDLWISKWDESNKTWSSLVNLGKGINSEKDEVFPYFKWNGELYFSSNGHLGLGGLDIFVSKPTGTGFGNPENLKPPLNSYNDDFGISYEFNEEKGYFSSNREGTKGKDDIYSFWKDPLTCTVEINVFDSKTQEPIQSAKVDFANIASLEKQTDETSEIGQVNYDSKVCKLENEYKIDISAKNYLKAQEKLSTLGHDQSVAYVLDFYLYSMDTVIELPEVRFPFDEATLLVDHHINSEDSLEFLYDIMLLNPAIKIELLAHTDTKGGVAYNLDLSQRRAESCIEYLADKGIPKSRMVAKGMGESFPRISDKEILSMSTEEERDAAHQKNRRVEFRVIKEEF
ncbi:MAG: OmpA family protein [Flavobacteriales bacterium]|nr:OmpA family protein [Flavobacteriales bacterium]